MKLVKTIFPLVMLAIAAAPALGDGGKDAKTTEQIATIRLIKKDFVDLTARMLKVADLIEKTEPESAEAIRLAVNKAQAAFIAEDMEKVTELLRSGMTVVAVSRGEDVAKELKEMLRILQRESLDPDKRREKIERMKQALDQIRKLLAQQRKLETETRMSTEGEKVGKTWAGFTKELADITKAQEKLLKQTKTMPVAPAVRKLSDLRDQVRKLIKKQEGINEAADRAPVDKLPVVGEAQKSVAKKTGDLSKTLAAAAKGSPKSSEALKKAAQNTSQASGEMSKASKELSRSNTPGARPLQAQALADLRSAEQALSKAIREASEGSKAARLAKGQKKLGKRTSELSDKVARAARKAGMDADIANLSKAAGAMSKASQDLSAQRSKSAQKHQEEALRRLKDKNEELARLRRRAEEKAKKPLAKQAKPQKELGKRTEKTAENMKKSPDGKSNPMPGQASTAGAAKSMSKASSQMSQGKGSSANQNQKKAIEDLERAEQALKEEIARQEELAQDEQLKKIDQMLESILRKQKNVSKKTVEIAPRADREPDDREVVLSLTELSNAEGRLGDDVETVRRKLVKEGSTVVFPAVLTEIRNDLKKVQGRLKNGKAGELTRLVQKDVERSLQELIDAIRKELAERKLKKKSGGGGGGGGGKQPLVPILAELKMLRIMQIGVNKRTAAVAKVAKKGKLPPAEAKKEYKNLAGREQKLERMTKELAGKLRR